MLNLPSLAGDKHPVSVVAIQYFTAVLMSMCVMHVWNVSMRVLHLFMTMHMRMRLAGRIIRAMLMLVMRVMRVEVRMFNGLMNMVVFVNLSEV